MAESACFLTSRASRMRTTGEGPLFLYIGEKDWDPERVDVPPRPHSHFAQAGFGSLLGPGKPQEEEGP